MNLKNIIEKRDLVDVKSSMRSLSDFDIIEQGDLHWTDRDCKYRLCNFTIGMKVVEAVKRGVDHGERWVFYRLMKVDEQAGTLADATVANETPSETTKRYRDPTPEDLANGPIECEVRDVDTQDWAKAKLSSIDDSARLRFGGKTVIGIQLWWNQCRIEVSQ